MDTRILRFFIAVYEQKSLTKAAAVCFVSQPNISTGIKQLEDELKQTLFVRSRRGVEPTNEATYLYPIAKKLCGELDGLPTLFSETTFNHTLTIGVADSLPQTYLQSFFRTTDSLLKSVSWTVKDYTQKSEIKLIVREFKDIDDLFLPLWTEDYLLCIPDGHPLLEKEVIDLSTDLHNEKFLHCPACEAHGQCVSILSAAKQSFLTVANCETKTHLLSLLMAGLGLTFLPSGFLEGWPGFQTRPYIGPRYYREVGLAYSRRSLQNPAIAQIVDYFSTNKLTLPGSSYK